MRAFCILWAGQLADRFLEPAIMPGGVLAKSLSPYFGTGSGAGIGIEIVLGGLLAIITGLAGYLTKPIREIKSTMPDHTVEQVTA
jgi:DHA3 family macrolide efflux protein-like MFS transporter